MPLPCDRAVISAGDPTANLPRVPAGIPVSKVVGILLVGSRLVGRNKTSGGPTNAAFVYLFDLSEVISPLAISKTHIHITVLRIPAKTFFWSDYSTSLVHLCQARLATTIIQKVPSLSRSR